jgi:hypothetical protein
MPGGRGVTEIDEPETAPFFSWWTETTNTNVTETRYCEGANETTCISAQTNALSRVRSSGIKKKYNLDKNNDASYNTSSKQYLRAEIKRSTKTSTTFKIRRLHRETRGSAVR